MNVFSVRMADLTRFGGEETAPPAPQAGTPAPSPAGESGGVRVLSPDSSAPAAGGQNQGEDPAAAFSRLIKGEFKDQFAAEVQNIINRRFKETKGLRERLAAQQGVLDKLLSRYHIQGGDLAALDRAIESDSALWAGPAAQAGMSVEQYRQFQNTRLENQRLRAERQATAAREEVRRQAAAWAREARALKERYGDFDLLAELQSPAFQAMLRSGTPMQNAYEALHLSDIKAGVARKAGQAREKQVTDHIRARGGRPAEGASSGAGVTWSADPGGLTPQQRDELARRAERGERISFR